MNEYKSDKRVKKICKTISEDYNKLKQINI